MERREKREERQDNVDIKIRMINMSVSRAFISRNQQTNKPTNQQTNKEKKKKEDGKKKKGQNLQGM